MKLVVCFPQAIHNERPVECYARSFVREVRNKGHEVTCVGSGHSTAIENINWNKFDYLIDIDNGRDDKGNLPFIGSLEIPIKKAVWFIDSHGHPDLHESIAKYYDHVFFAVWSKRDLFKDHPSTHWLPNCTDLVWFDFNKHLNNPLQYEFGFFGSKGGLHRADPLKAVCDNYGMTYDIRQISKSHRHKWPHFAEAMCACFYLFNKGQKHDSPNQRVMESMILQRPLLTDNDSTSGMPKIFQDGIHYIGYSYGYEDLEEKVKWMINNPQDCMGIAKSGYQEVKFKHLIGNRVDSILEVINV